MISLIEARRFRCLKYIHQPLEAFHVLVGPNASGKTTFLDVVSFLGAFVSEGLEAALAERTRNFEDLVWRRESPSEFELAIEANIPDELQEKLHNPEFQIVRYEVKIAIERKTEEVVIRGEKGVLRKHPRRRVINRTLFPMNLSEPYTIMTAQREPGTRTVFNKVWNGNDNYYSEVYRTSGKGWAPAFKLGPTKSTLGNLPEDESKFPVSTWLKTLLTEGVQSFVLNSSIMRKASPPGQARTFRSDGSNLPWVIQRLKEKAPENFQDWVSHLQTALPDLESIRTVERPDDKHRYLILCYKGGLDVPSWMASDGTLRLLALTLPAYLPEFQGIYLIEEPENGIHPLAVETLYRALSSVYRAQILLATHSPVILSEADPELVLCFAKTEKGATDIVRGSEHPKLRQWRGETNLGVLFAAGVLGQ